MTLLNKLLATSGFMALGAAMVAAAPSDAYAGGKDMERCAGIVKAGHNDCGANDHSCAGQASEDGDENEWIALPEGTCDKIVGGHVVEGKAHH